MRTTLARAVILALFLLCALASAGGAQITQATVRQFQTQTYAADNISGTPTYVRSLVMDADSAGPTDLVCTVAAVIDSLTAVIEVNGSQGSTPIRSHRDTVKTNVNYYLPSYGMVTLDSIFIAGLTRTRPLVVGEAFRFTIAPAKPPTYSQYLVNADSISNAAADTIYFGAVNGAGETVDFLVSAGSAYSDSTVFSFGYQTLNGLTWSGGVNTRVTVVADSVHVHAGSTVRIPVTAMPAGTIRPVVWGRANTCKRKVLVNRIKVLWRNNN